MTFKVVALALALCAIACTAQSIPGVRFTTDDIGKCNPADVVFEDPRSQGYADFLRDIDMYDQVKRLFSVRGGTVIIPTEAAIEKFLALTGFENAADMYESTGGNATWAPVLSAYFMSNVSRLPRDVTTPRAFRSPYGDITLPLAVYGPTPVYRLYTYIQIAQIDDNTFQMQSGFLRFLAANNQGQAGIARMGTPSNFSDWTLACDQYVIYYTDDMMAPFDDAADLQRFAMFAPKGSASVIDFDTGRQAEVPDDSANSQSNNGRRLMGESDVVLLDSKHNAASSEAHVAGMQGRKLRA